MKEETKDRLNEVITQLNTELERKQNHTKQLFKVYGEQIAYTSKASIYINKLENDLQNYKLLKDKIEYALNYYYGALKETPEKGFDAMMHDIFELIKKI